MVIRTGEGLNGGGGVNNSLDMARPVLACAGPGVIFKRNFSLRILSTDFVIDVYLRWAQLTGRGSKRKSLLAWVVHIR
jgi:hypothetical protein